ncbi:alpha-1,6-mannosyltransferase subunit [Abortiporus biennis]|nr:alpha-1,6-mannosyltransferase subunit [Abortiporus biennis]
MSVVLDALLLATCGAYVYLAPYTKVEESFNLHATHDVFMYGIGADALQQYDHFIFPGAVPRTFIGSILLAWLSTPFVYIANYLGLAVSKVGIQTIIRLVLATCNAITLCLLRRAVSRRYGTLPSMMFTIITVTQFHLPFWAGRTLPNMFALIPVNLASYALLNRASNASRVPEGKALRAIGLLIFTAVVFRAEVALLLAPIVLQLLFTKSASLTNLVKWGLVYGLISIASTVLVDSYFWQQWPLWPEFNSVYFNVIEGKSSEWGVEPFHQYFMIYIPKLLLASLPFPFVGALVDSRIRATLVPSLVFITLLSTLGHKEWRFIVYTVPIFNVAGAKGAAWLLSKRKGSFFGKLASLVVVGLILCNVTMTYLLTVTAMANYPGGDALVQFNKMYVNETNVHVHISNLAAQTGASLFLQTNAPPYPAGFNLTPPPRKHPWVYDKTENLTPADLTADFKITHVISEIDTKRTSDFSMKDWMIGGFALAYEGWTLKKDNAKTVEEWARSWDLLEMVKKPKLMVLAKRSKMKKASS